MLYRTAKTTLAVLLIIIGIILTPMPVPFGIIFILCGLTLLATVSHKVRVWITRCRARYPGFSRSLNRVKYKVPAAIRRLIEETEPEVKAGINP